MKFSCYQESSVIHGYIIYSWLYIYSVYFIDTDEISTRNTTFFKLHFRNSKIVQLKWSPIAKCLSEKCYAELGYMVIKEK